MVLNYYLYPLVSRFHLLRVAGTLDLASSCARQLGHELEGSWVFEGGEALSEERFELFRLLLWTLTRFVSLSSQAQHGYAIGDPDTTPVQQ